MRKLVAVYGSLKKGFYNHYGLGEDAEYLGNMIVTGVMYSNGSYPKLYRTNEDQTFEAFNQGKERNHEVEVYSINEARYHGITSMEVGAGYTPEDIETPYGMATIYWMPHDHFYDGDHWVESYSKTHLNNLY